MNSLPIHIAFCVNDGYVPYIAVTIKSIVENHENVHVTIHVLSDYISKEKKELLSEAIRNCKNINLEIHIVDDTSLRGLKDTWSIYTWYRVLLPKVLPNSVQRVLYLDADTLVVASLESLFEIDMTEKAIGCCIDPESFHKETFARCGYEEAKKYVCAGVMLMNLDYWRKNNLTDKVITWGRENNDTIKFPDQDTINYLCRDNKIILPLRYGVIGGFFMMDELFSKEYATELQECIERPAIIHYAGQAPWKKELANHLFQDEWIRYNKMLKHPAKQHYITKGWLKIKMHVWNLLHPNNNDKRITKENVLKRLTQLL